MHTGDQVPIISEDTNIKDAILEMTSKRFGVTSVVNKKGELIGIFTDGDLRRLIEKTANFFDLKAKEAMTTNPKVISENALAARALNLMEFFNITCLIIVNGERKPSGIVHLHDLLKAGVV